LLHVLVATSAAQKIAQDITNIFSPSPVQSIEQAIGNAFKSAVSHLMTDIGSILASLTKLQGMGQAPTLQGLRSKKQQSDFGDLYLHMEIIAVWIGLGTILFGVIEGAIMGQTGRIAKTVVRVLAGLVASALLILLLPLLQRTFAFLAMYVASTVGGLNSAHIGTKLNGLFGVTSIGVILVLYPLAILGALFVLLALLASVGIVYLVAVLCPVLFVISGKSAKRAIEVLVVALATPALITLTLTLGIVLFADGPSTAGGMVGSTIIGTGMIFAALFSPFMLLKMLPGLETHMASIHNARSQATRGLNQAKSGHMQRWAGGQKSLADAKSAAQREGRKLTPEEEKAAFKSGYLSTGAASGSVAAWVGLKAMQKMHSHAQDVASGPGGSGQRPPSGGPAGAAGGNSNGSGQPGPKKPPNFRPPPPKTQGR